MEKATDEREHRSQVAVVEDDGGAVVRQVTGVEALMGARVRVGYK
ncbi:hypothetical protein LCGC14_2508900, partial [marine sediment metagenome]